MMLMADNSDSTNLAALPSYAQLKLPEQLMVRLKLEGNTNQQIATGVQQEYGISRNADSIRQMFNAGGRLEQAFLDAADFFGKSSIAKMNAKLDRSTEAAANVVILGMSETQDMATRIRSAQIVLNRYPRKTEIDLTINTTAPPPIMAAVLAEHDELLTAGRQALETEETEET